MPGEGHRWLAYAHELGSVLPDFEPDAEMARRCLAIANRVRRSHETVIARMT
jgi:hypothetical protein